MNLEKIQSLLVGALLIGLILVGVLVLWPYFSALVLAGVFAIACEPIFKKILFAVRYRWIASLLTVLFVLIVILVPVAFFGTLVFGEAQQIYMSIEEQGSIGSGQGLLVFINEKISALIPVGWGNINVENYINSVVSWLVTNLGLVFSTIAQGVLTFALSLFVLFYFFKDEQKIKNFIIEYNPLSQKNALLIIDKIRNSVNSVIRGSLVVAILQGIVTGIGFAIFGISNPALWGGVAVFAALVPTFGTSLIIIPAILYLWLSGGVGYALGLLVWGMVAVGLLDNFLGPQLVKRGTHIHPLLILLSVLGGVSFFGPLGFILGPLVFSLLFAML
ncbi:MAG TPA: AI-2E family transporter, partial [Candidatus Paceibacterota bacterium]|nr:AI-2E family transporter [Candidatus Paceibacterota bacterium]